MPALVQCERLMIKRALLSTERARSSTFINSDFGVTFDNWIDGVQWMNPESIDWVTFHRRPKPTRIF